MFWRDSEPGDPVVIAPRLRSIDLQELRDVRGPGVSPEAALAEAVKICRPCHTLCLASGLPVAMHGVTPLTPGVGVVWLLGTPEAFEGVARRSFVRLTRRWLDEQNETYPILANRIRADNIASIAWLSWAGAVFEPRTYEINGQPYFQFVRTKNVRSNSRGS